MRQLPASCVDRDAEVIIGPGSYIDVEILLSEIEALGISKRRILISPFARIIEREHKDWETESRLTAAIGSTGSGVGAALMAAVAREASNFPLLSRTAEDDSRLTEFVGDTTHRLRRHLNGGGRVVVEGTQGFGLSLLQGGFWPKATSRDTTAAGALSEAGLSPLDVDEVVLVIRTFPIRVAGESGPLKGETTWSSISKGAGISDDIREFTTATNRLRRVGEFDSEIVKRSIDANNPSLIVLNHLDYIGSSLADLKARDFIESVEKKLDRNVDFAGFSPKNMDLLTIKSES